jgi:RNA polymerase-binding transcription factor DksA
MAVSTVRARPRRQLRACHDELVRVYEDLYTQWRRQQMVVNALRDGLAGDQPVKTTDAARLAALAQWRATESRLRAGLDRVRAALARWDAGTYGRCPRCGHRIPVGRLLAAPLATVCGSCEAARPALSHP